MRKYFKNGISLKWGLVLIMAACWLVPISAILLFSGQALSKSVKQRLSDTIKTSADIVFEQTLQRLEYIMAASRKSSYSSAISSAYKEYQVKKDRVVLYERVTDYLIENYCYDPNFNATLLFFTAEPETVYYASSRTDMRELDGLRRYKSAAHKSVLEAYPSIDTGIRFMKADGKLYMVRNMMDSTFTPYAVIVMECDEASLYENIRGIVWVKGAAISLDGNTHLLSGNTPHRAFTNKDTIEYDEKTKLYTVQKTAVFSGHTLRLSVEADGAGLIEELPDVLAILLLMGGFGALLFIFVLFAHYHYVAKPVGALVEASEHVEKGEIGYTIPMLAKSREFRYLIKRFNNMSAQLKAEFERSYLEQLALSDARVKALRSQINPHFLNNTLEAISWAARMAKDTKVCSMIDALSTMLDAAMARGGRGRDTVEQELAYADAYLYILSQRLGDRLKVEKQVDPKTLKLLVPSLILQPIVENAFEHGISLLSKGEICIRIGLENDMLVLEVENDGRMKEEDKANIKLLLNLDQDAGIAESSSHIGIRNVSKRLRLLYGERSSLTLLQLENGRVLARLVIPELEYAAEALS
ncbi:MAG TPA: histidine kinase [Clostridia bacterium]|nr:histidine kinase [Clostridia bacterium]